MQGKARLGSLDEYSRIASSMRRILPQQFARYNKVETLSNAYADRQLKDPQKDLTKIVVQAPGLVRNWSWKSFKDLILLDQKFVNAEFFIKIAGPKVSNAMNSHIPISRMLNNSLYNGYVSADIENNRELLENQKQKKVQIFYSQLIAGPKSGKEVEKPKDIQVPFDSKIGPLKFNIPTLVIYKDIRALGISDSHPNFQELVNSEVILPLIGPVPISHIQQDVLESQDPEVIVAITPSHILQHSTLFPEVTPAPIDKFSDSETGEPVGTHALGRKISDELGVLNSQADVVPYIVEKYFDDDDKPLTAFMDGGQVLLRYFNHVAVIEKGKKSDKFPKHWFTGIANSESTDTRDRDLGAKEFSLADLSYKRFVELLYEGKTLNEVKRVRDRNYHFERFSTDIFRSLVLSKERISDTDINNEYQLVDLYNCILQYHWTSNAQRLGGGVHAFQGRIGDLLSGNKSELVKPWDRVLVNRFFQIKDKKDVDNFIKSFAIYQLICKAEVNPEKNRWRLIYELTNNLLIRFLKDHGKLYFPSISNFMARTMNLHYDFTSFTPVEGEKVNDFQNYITYPIEDLEYDTRDDELYTVIEQLLSAVRMGPFYQLNKIILTENPIILNNKELLENLNPEGKITFNEVDKNISSSKFVDKIAGPRRTDKVGKDLAEETSRYSLDSKIIFYRDYCIEDVLPVHVHKKLHYIKFAVSPDVRVEVLRKDLLMKLLGDLNRYVKYRESDKFNRPITRSERERLFSFTTRFVKKLPDQVFKHPLIKQASLEEFDKSANKRNFGKSTQDLSSLTAETDEELEVQLDGIVMGFLQKVNQMDRSIEVEKDGQ